ncbi:hypothetical protein BN1195_00682 [Chryseobacterium oranimense G311]|jgi:hypothetical protein|uniref:hypothetical protein n=1 Tax=Chryseobacterium oranimense TaxID=421058 RepID=UPI000533A8BE|nr:hypothetical protein [Chryseobacterium oranimense]CEJ68395.1 hypothetical protein BN1195_00682 [Chryseobacterium oranimense G311]
MKKTNLTKISRKELRDVFGGYLYPAQCPGGCHGEAMIRCPDGSTTMTNYICMGGRCEVNTGFCKPLVLDPGTVDPGPVLLP